ncbi:MAG: transposase [Oligoflexia bacterium]|nr:transposase [Oligoflexia bacterium]
MPRKKKLFNPYRPYHITARCINREWFGLPMDHLWEFYSDYLFLINKMYQVEIFSFVLMPNHFHLIARFQNKNMSEAMNYFMRETSRYISSQSGRINQIYGAPYHKSCLSTDNYFYHAYKYIYRNPVDAELTSKVEDYKYSSLFGLLGQSKLIIPITEDLLLFNQNMDETLTWLNKDYKKTDRNLIRCALRKSEFAFATKNGLKSDLETWVV